MLPASPYILPIKLQLKTYVCSTIHIKEIMWNVFYLIHHFQHKINANQCRYEKNNSALFSRVQQ